MKRFITLFCALAIAGCAAADIADPDLQAASALAVTCTHVTDWAETAVVPVARERDFVDLMFTVADECAMPPAPAPVLWRRVGEVKALEAQMRELSGETP